MNQKTKTVSSLAAQASKALAQGNFREAAQCLQQLLDLDPRRPDDWYNLGYCLRQVGEDEKALEAYSRALDLGAAGPEEIHLNRAVILSDQLRRDDDAEAELSAALKLNTEYAPAWLNLGNLHEERGRRPEAVECYQTLRALKSADPALRFQALARLAQLDPPTSNDLARLDELERAARTPGLDRATAVSLYMALARAADRLDQSDRAFAAMRAGNRLAGAAGPGYKHQQQEARVDALIRAFPAEPATATQQTRPEGRDPLFILGLYRSGSTLIEQMLAAHPDVHAGGELDILPRLVREYLPDYPADAANLDGAMVDKLATLYRDQASRRFPDLDPRTLMTDKRPDNHAYVGLLARMFPTARFIHTVRQPLDNALSIFMEHLELRVAPYASDLGNIGHFLVHNRRLMAHWHKVVPGRILDCSYDHLVTEPERTLGQVLEFLDLPWDERCLQFHQTAATVKTASYWQVRQPLYSQASGRWKRYRPHLVDLEQWLAGAGIDPTGG